MTTVITTCNDCGHCFQCNVGGCEAYYYEVPCDHDDHDSSGYGLYAFGRPLTRIDRFNMAFYSAKTAIVAGVATAFLFGLLLGGSFAASSQLDAMQQQTEAQTWNAAVECLYNGGELRTEGCLR